FVMGGGTGRRNAEGRIEHGGFWRDADTWPLPQTEWSRFYLQAYRSLGPALPEEGRAALGFTADPRDPVPTIGGALSSGEPVMRSGAYDQCASPRVFGAKPPYGQLAARSDVLSLS